MTTTNKTRALSTQYMTRIAVLTALSSILFLISIPVIAFYHLDFSNLPVLLGAFSMGPVPGMKMVIFPEGTRSKGGPTHEFKAGSFKLATKSKVPIIPVTINGSYNLLEANGGGKIKSSNVEVIIHAPIETSKLSKEELASLHETVENIIVKDIKKA